MKVTTTLEIRDVGGMPAVTPVKGISTDRTSQRKTLRNTFTLSIILIATVVLNSQYAQAVCNVCTVIPACIFSFAQLSDHNTQIFAYKATLFYWTISGLLLASDSVFVDSMGYFFGKFLLLTALFLNVVYQHQVSRRLNERQQRHTQATASLITARTLTNTNYQWKQARSSLEILDNKRGICANSISTASSASVHNIDVTAFSDVDYTISEGSLNAPDWTEGNARQGSDGEQCEGSDGIIAGTSFWAESMDAVSRIIAKRESKPNFSSETTRVGDQVSLANDPPANSIQLIIDENGSFIARPSENVTFTAPFKDPITVIITNNSKCNMAWTFTTNAVERLIAEPNSGILPSGAVTEFKLSLAQMPSMDKLLSDRISIDYNAVHESITFDRILLQAAESACNRLKLDVRYEF